MNEHEGRMDVSKKSPAKKTTNNKDRIAHTLRSSALAVRDSKCVMMMMLQYYSTSKQQQVNELQNINNPHIQKGFGRLGRFGWQSPNAGSTWEFLL